MSLQYKLGFCTECPAGTSEQPIVKKILPNKYCATCNTERLEARKPKKSINWAQRPRKQLKRSPIKQKPRKPTGELVLFQSIWETRPHVSFVSGVDLGEEMNVSMFSHLLTKAAYPGYRLYDKNIVLKTPQEHFQWHNLPREKLLEKSPNWQKVFDLYDELQHEYYNS